MWPSITAPVPIRFSLRFAFYLATLTSLFLFWIIAFPRSVYSQETPASSSEADRESGDFSKSIILPRDRVMERDLEAILAAISTENWTSIAQVLFRLTSVLSSGTTISQGGLVELDGVVCSTDVAIARVFERLPSTGRGVVLRLVEPIVQEQLTSALREQDSAALQQIARRYRFTPTGQQARKLYQQYRRDLGDTATFEQEIAQELKSVSPSGWSQRSDSPEVTRQTVSTLARYLRQSGFSPYPKAHIAFGPNALLATLAESRVAVDPSTGQQLWSRPIPGYGANWYRKPGDLGDFNRRRLFSIVAGRRVFGDAIYARSAADSSRFYFLESIMDETVPSSEDSDPALEEKELYNPFPANRLVCVDQKTGETLWTQPQELEKSIFYAGTPLVTNGILWILGESRSTQSLALYQYDTTTGNLIESIEVAQARLAISQDMHRQEIDCPVTCDGDQIFCPTAAGGLFAVDRWTGDVLWAHRFARNDTTEYRRDAMDLMGIQAGFDHLSGWQGTQIFPVDDLLVSVSPERDELLVVEQETGRQLWNLQPPEGMHLVCANAECGVVVIGKTKAVSYDLRTGEQKWITPIPTPAGEGVVLKGRYLFPILDSGVAQLDLHQGHLLTDLSSRGSHPPIAGPLPTPLRFRNLTAIGSTLYEIEPNGFRQFPDNKQDAQLEQSSVLVSEAPVIQQIRQALKNSDVQRGMELARQVLESNSDQADRSETELRHALWTLFGEHLTGQSDVEARTTFATLVLQLPMSLAERGAWRKQWAQSAILKSDVQTFVTIWLTSPDEELTVTLTDGDDWNLQSRLDRWFQQTASELTEQHARALDQAVQKTLPEISSANDAQLQSLLKRLGQTRWGDQLRMQNRPPPPDLAELLRLQLHLKIQAESSDPALAAGAAWKLFELYRQREQILDAARWLNHLGRFDPEHRLPDGQTVREVCSHFIPELQKKIDTDPLLAPWAETVASKEIRNRGSREVYLVPMRVPQFMETGFERLAVELDFPGRQAVRFNGSGWARPWYCQLTQNNRPVPYDETMDHCWGLEQLLVVQCGSNLSAVTPFDVAGKPRAKLLWSTYATVSENQEEQTFFLQPPHQESIPERPGYPFRSTIHLDEFHHPVVEIGPVRPGYLCRQHLGMLIAHDPTTGDELWRRYDLPGRANCYGDDEQIAVVSRDQMEVHFYSAIDGRHLASRPRQHDPNDVVGSDGLNLTLVQGVQSVSSDSSEKAAPEEGKELPAPDPSPAREIPPHLPDIVVSRLDLTSGDVVWERRWAASGIPFEIDEHWMGILTAQSEVKRFDLETGNTVRKQLRTESQEIELIDLKTGETISTHPIEFLNPVRQIYCSQFDTDVLILFSDETHEEGWRRSERIRSGYRRPRVKGVACCFSRETGGLRWSQPLKEVEFPLDQPQDLPVLIAVEVRPYEPDFSEIFDSDETDLPAPDKLKAEALEKDTPKEPPPPPGVFIHCYHRQTGELLYTIQEPSETLPSYTVTGQRSKGTVQLQTVRTRLDLHFAPVTPTSGTDSTR